MTEKKEGRDRAAELQDALSEWQGLTDDQRGRFYATTVPLKDLSIAQFALRLLKAAELPGDACERCRGRGSFRSLAHGGSVGCRDCQSTGKRP